MLRNGCEDWKMMAKQGKSHVNRGSINIKKPCFVNFGAPRKVINLIPWINKPLGLGCLIGGVPFMYHIKWLFGGYPLINKPWSPQSPPNETAETVLLGQNQSDPKLHLKDAKRLGVAKDSPVAKRRERRDQRSAPMEKDGWKLDWYHMYPYCLVVTGTFFPG